jgi:hypothetical protein
MIEVPSMAELYDAVDAAFRAAHPDSPTRLSASRPEDGAWRRRWLVLRDEHLHREVDRICWARHPEAPLRLDLSNPVHDRYRQLWLDIRQALWDNAPEPPAAEDDTVDLSYLRAGVNESLLRFLPEIRPDLHDELRAFTDQCIVEAASALRR